MRGARRYSFAVMRCARAWRVLVAMRQQCHDAAEELPCHAFFAICQKRYATLPCLPHIGFTRAAAFSLALALHARVMSLRLMP